MQVMYLGRAPRTKETLPDFLKWCRVTRHPLVFRGLTGSQRTPGCLGVTGCLPAGMPSSCFLVLGEMEVACSASLSPPARKFVLALILPLLWFP